MKEITSKQDLATWAAQRSWSLSGNRDEEGIESNSTSHTSAQRVSFPTSTTEISSILSSLPPETPVASVCGGHSSSNASTHPPPCPACPAVIFDLCNLNSIEIHPETFEVTVGGGTLFRQLAEAVRDAGGALPIGTGDTVGVMGYVLNGGISGYFGRRLGMLGQRCTRLTVVLADGTVRDLSQNSSISEDNQLFHALLGAGSALGIVTSTTFQMERGTAVRYGGQLVVPCGNRTKSKAFAREALGFLKDCVLPDTSVSMELVVTADYTVISTFIFYDSFNDTTGGYANLYVELLRRAARDLGLPIAADDMTQWKTWFDMASCLWPIIADMKGDPLLRWDHCMGTNDIPSDNTLDFVTEEWMCGIPFDQAPMSIVEARTLGGAMMANTEKSFLPSGNAKIKFFLDMIVACDAKGMSAEQRREIRRKTNAVVALAREQDSVQVDFSGTHSQSDDDGPALKGEEIFGSKEALETVRLVKHRVDPTNRFRFHPFVSVL